MSLTKKDPSLRVAATDPHLVSLGGGRLSTAVTIHYIQIGDTTIGSSKACSISLNGTGVRAVHCTIYRSECNEVTIVPEQDARILIDGTKISEETNLTQGAMITIGNSNYLRFNNPDEAMMMRSAIGSNERISMPQIDFTQVPTKVGSTNSNSSNTTGATTTTTTTTKSVVVEAPKAATLELETYYETIINPSLGAHQVHNNQQLQLQQQQQRQEQLMSKSLIAMPTSAAAAAASLTAAANTGGSLSKSSYKYISPPIDINGMQCPKVFTADLITVNMPAKDVLGQKYASFAKNLAENHRNEKHMNNTSKSNQLSKSLTQPNGDNSLTHIPSATNNCIQPQQSQQQQHQHHQHPHQHQHQQQLLHTMHMAASSTTPVALGKYKLNATTTCSTEPLLTKVQNTSTVLRGQQQQQQQQHHQPAPVNLHNHHHLQIHQLQQPHPAHQNHVNAYDRYPKPGTYGGLQIYPMNGVNTEINNLSHTETDMLEDMLKICTEYANQSNSNNMNSSNNNNPNSNNMNSSNNSITSSPIVQNRIKTNGSLPREKKSPFHHDLSSAQWHSGSSGNLATKQSLNNSSVGGAAISSSSGYENVCLLGPNRVEINGQLAHKPSAGNVSVSSKSGYENVSLIANTAAAAAATSTGKYVPQSPRTKIRTTCMSPKKDMSFGSSFGLITPPAPKPGLPLQQHQQQQQQQHLPASLKPLAKKREYEQLIKSFERRLQLEMKAIEESSRYQPATAVLNATTSASSTPSKRVNKNINNLTLNLQQSHSLQNSPKLSKKPTPAPRLLNKSLPAGAAEDPSAGSCNSNNKEKELKRSRLELKSRIAHLRTEIAELQTQAEAATGVDQQFEESSETRLHRLQSLQTKIHRLEAQRNATRVMEENQQAKLKQAIEMKQEQVKKLRAMLVQKPNNECLKEELEHVSESLESDRKTFEDLEFQYFEEESEFHACYEELKRVEKRLTLENELATCMERLSGIDALDGDQHDANDERDNADSADDFIAVSPIRASKPLIADASIQRSNLVNGVMSQSLFGSAELLCPKRASEDVMSKSVNENLVFNHKIELPHSEAHATNIAATATTPPTVVMSTSTPKRAQFQVFDIDVAGAGSGPGPGSATAATASGAKERLKQTSDHNGGSNGEERGNGDGVEDSDREQVPFNLSLRGERFAVNPLERRVPSQDDIDRSCKVASDAPISAGRSPSTKIFDSIKEIERNRKLLLAQQGHHVIEHERQKMCDLKKKSHDEARTQYLRTINASKDNIETLSIGGGTELTAFEQLKPNDKQLHENASKARNAPLEHNNNINSKNNDKQQRHSQPDLELQQSLPGSTPPPLLPRSPRPLSEANSEQSCELLETTTTSSARKSLNAANSSNSVNADGVGGGGGGADVNKRASTNSNETTSAGSGGERKRMLPKHQRPLTRYLPIFSPDLNLRHHIESAGHQIDLCPHVFVDAHSCRGYLHKLGATFHAWSRRWFVLDRQRSALIYYSDKSERKPRGGAYFATIDEVYLDHLNASKSGRPHCTFIVKTKKRSYNLQAASDAAARIWIDAIITGAQGNLDY